VKDLSASQFAKAMGVHRSTVSRWLAAGRIEFNAHGRIDPEAAKTQLSLTESPQPHHQANISRIESEKAEKRANQSAGQPHGNSNSNATEGNARNAARNSEPALREAEITSKQIVSAAAMRLKLAMASEREGKAQLVALDLDKRVGELVERSDVEFVLRDLGQTLRGALEGFADRLAPVVAGCGGDVNGIHSSISEASHNLLNEISHHLSRREASLASPETRRPAAGPTSQPPTGHATSQPASAPAGAPE